MRRKSRIEECPLNIYEQNVLLPILVNALKIKKGRKNAVKSKQIIEGLHSHGLKIKEKQVHRIINHIRMNDIVVGLMGSSVGYYIIDSELDFINYEDGLMKRETALRNVRICIERQRKSKFTECLCKQKQVF